MYLDTRLPANHFHNEKINYRGLYVWVLQLLGIYRKNKLLEIIKLDAILRKSANPLLGAAVASSAQHHPTGDFLWITKNT